MKKAFGYGFTGLIFAWTITSITYSQSSNSTAKFKQHPSLERIIPISKQLKAARDSDFLFRNEINGKAVRNFIREYKNVAEAKWYISPNGFVVHFSSENIQNWIYYTKKGDFEFMLRHYNEVKLPAEIRHRVKSNYYDFSIYHVSEIRYNGKTAWYVTIEDKTCWKKIKVLDSEMEVVEVYSKG